MSGFEMCMHVREVRLAVRQLHLHRVHMIVERHPPTLAAAGASIVR